MEDIKLNNENLNTNSSSNDTTIVNKPKKQFSRRKLIGILCGSLGAAALVGGITPLAIYVKNKNKVVTHDVVIQDGSTKGVKILAKDIQLNKESTITIQLPEGDYLDLDNNPNVNVSVGGKKLVKNTDFTIEAIDNYGSIVRLSSEEETKAHSLYRIYITPEASTSLDVSIKVISETIDFEFNNEKLSEEGFWYGQKPTITPSRPKFHKPLKIDFKDRLFKGEYDDEGADYLFDETILGSDYENSIVIKVGEGENEKTLTKDDVIFDNTAQTITIKEGVINGPVKMLGRLNKFTTVFDAEDYVIEDSLPKNAQCTYGYTDDYIEAFKLESSHKDKWGNWTAGGINPEVSIWCGVYNWESGGMNWSQLSKGTEQDPQDFYLSKSCSTTDRKYHYDIIFTKQGREKVVGPLWIYCGATDKDNIVIAPTEEGNSVILGLPSNCEYTVWYNASGTPLDGKVTMVDDGGTGYIYNEESKKLEVPDGVQPKAGKITLGGTLDSAYTERTIEVKEAAFSNTFKEIDNGIEKDPDFSDGVVKGHTYKITTSIDPSIDVKWAFSYNSTELPDECIKFDHTDNTSKFEILKVPELGKNNVLDITVNATLGDSGTKVFQEDKHIKLNIVNEIFARTSWDDICTAVSTYYEDPSEEVQKKLCWNFGDIKYIEEGTTAKEHLANFIGKEHKLNIVDSNNGTDTAVEHTMRIVDIEHDTIADDSNKKALFTFDSKEVVTNWEGKAITSIWNTSDGKNHDFSNSVLYKNLNSSSSTSSGGWADNTLINRIAKSKAQTLGTLTYILDTSKIKEVTKQVGEYKSSGEPGKKYEVKEYTAKFFPLTMTEMSMAPEGEHPGYLEEGSPYAYYVGKEAEDKMKAPAVINESNAIAADHQYWLTSPSFVYDASGELQWDYCSWLVDENGNPNGDYEVWHCGNEGIGVSFAFCI